VFCYRYSPVVDFEDLLEKTSRTFALSIPLLEEPTRRYVTSAYLLFRIADTFEDAATWPRQERIAALERFSQLLCSQDDGALDAERWVARRPTEHLGYLELLTAVPSVLAELRSFEARPQEIVRHHTLRTADGMARIVARADDKGELRLGSLEELAEYCYVVAGIVGEMLTDLFIDAEPALEGVAESLRSRAATFGEALQLVNILKDAADDREEGRRFLPATVDREIVFARARTDLEVAQEYTEIIRRSDGAPGTIAFTTLPVRLAWLALQEVEQRGAGAKVPRHEVQRIVGEVTQDRQRTLDRQQKLPRRGRRGEGLKG
jgi:farnesyl-diphosphate farnesyltransferase